MKLLTLAELSPTVRPFQLSNQEFVKILYSYKVLCEDHPGVEDYNFRGPRPKEVLSVD